MGVAYSVGEVDHLYTFFVQWSPDIYTKGSKKQRYLIREKHPNHYLSHPVNPTEKNWERQVVEMKLLPENVKVLYIASDCVEPYVEIIRVKDSKHRLSLCSSEDSEAEEPQYQEEGDDALLVLSEHSQLLDDEDVEQLAAHMPARTKGYPWQLVYSTAIHGSSLNTLYRNMAGLDSPVLLIIRDVHKKVFGAFSTDPFRVSKYYYGTGETFLFSFNPDFQAYRWSGENSYFVSGKLDSLQIGGGGDGFALWLDADLYHGASFSCPTFHNAPLSMQKDFIVQDLEIWTLQN